MRSKFFVKGLVKETNNQMVFIQRKLVENPRRHKI